MRIRSCRALLFLVCLCQLFVFATAFNEKTAPSEDNTKTVHSKPKDDLIPPILEVLEYLRNYHRTLYFPFLLYVTENRHVLLSKLTPLEFKTHFVDNPILSAHGVSISDVRACLKNQTFVPIIRKRFSDYRSNVIPELKNTVENFVESCDAWIVVDNVQYCDAKVFVESALDKNKKTGDYVLKSSVSENIVAGSAFAFDLIHEPAVFNSVKNESLPIVLYADILSKQLHEFLEVLSKITARGNFMFVVRFKPSNGNVSLRESDPSSQIFSGGITLSQGEDSEHTIWNFLASSYFHFFVFQIILENWIATIVTRSPRPLTTPVRLSLIAPILLFQIMNLIDLFAFLFPNHFAPTYKPPADILFRFFQLFCMHHSLQIFINCLAFGAPHMDHSEPPNLLWMALSLHHSPNSRDMMIIATIYSVQMIFVELLSMHQNGWRYKLIPTTLTGLAGIAHFATSYNHGFMRDKSVKKLFTGGLGAGDVMKKLGQGYPLLLFITKLPEFFLFSIIILVGALHGFTYLVTGMAPRTRRLFLSHIRLQDDFSICVFKLGISCLDATQNSGFWNELDHINVPKNLFKMFSTELSNTDLVREPVQPFANNMSNSVLEKYLLQRQGTNKRMQRRQQTFIWVKLLRLFAVMFRRVLVGQQRGRILTGFIEDWISRITKTEDGNESMESETDNSTSNAEWDEKKIWEDFKQSVVEPDSIANVDEDDQNDEDFILSDSEANSDYDSDNSEGGENENDDEPESSSEPAPLQSSREENSSREKLPSSDSIYKELWELNEDFRDFQKEEQMNYMSSFLSSPTSPTLNTPLSPLFNQFLSPIQSVMSPIGSLVNASSQRFTRASFRNAVSSPSAQLTNDPEQNLYMNILDTAMRRRQSQPTASPTITQQPSQLDIDTRRCCVICASAPRNVILRPCNCFALCDDCRMELSLRKTELCPCCRGRVLGYSKIYEP